MSYKMNIITASINISRSQTPVLSITVGAERFVPGPIEHICQSLHNKGNDETTFCRHRMMVTGLIYFLTVSSRMESDYSGRVQCHSFKPIPSPSSAFSGYLGRQKYLAREDFAFLRNPFRG